MSKEQYVTFEVAKLLKEKGFDWECRAYWHEDDRELIESQSPCHLRNITNPCWFGNTAPTQQMAMRWLREEHGIMITPDRDKIVNVAPEPFYDYWCTIRHNGNEHWVSSLDLPDSQHYTEYEDVVEAALKYCLTNLI